MFELYKCEAQRFLKGALICLLGLIVVFFMLPRLGFWDVLHRNMGFLVTLGAIFLSLGFGVFHGILWRRKNFWLFLIHRPMSPKRIYLSLLAAGITVILTTVSLSLLSTILAYDVFTDKVVDNRHYQFVFYITLLSIACYMVGTLTVLHRSKFVILVFYALLMAFFPEPRNLLAQYLPLILMLTALFYLNIQCFKPDLEQPLVSKLGTGLLVTGVSYGVGICLLLATTLFYHIPLIVVGKHPDSNPQPGTMRVMWQDNFENGVGYVLEHSEHPQAAHYARQASMTTRMYLPTRQWQPPRQHQLHRFDHGNALFNKETSDIWQFSHDEMLLLGVNQNTNQFIGAIGINGLITDLNNVVESDRFTEVPHLSGEQFLSTKTALYTIDFDTHSLVLKYQTETGEYLTSSLRIWRQVGLLSTNQHLLMFDSETLLNEFSELHVDYKISHPESTVNAENAYAIPVSDGYLLLYYDDNYFGFDRPGAEVFITRLDGSFERLGGREFGVYPYPAWIRHYDFMVAPIIFVTEELVMSSIDPYETRFLNLEMLQSQRYPTAIYIAAIILQIFSVIALWIVINCSTMRSGLRKTWLALGTVLGAPVLISYLLLQPIKQK